MPAAAEQAGVVWVVAVTVAVATAVAATVVAATVGVMVGMAAMAATVADQADTEAVEDSVVAGAVDLVVAWREAVLEVVVVQAGAGKAEALAGEAAVATEGMVGDLDVVVVGTLQWTALACMWHWYNY